MIYYITPYATDKNLGKAYNQHIQNIPYDTDWVCIRDLDTMLLGKDIGHQLEHIISKHSNIHLFTAVTNRIGTEAQLEPGLFNKTDIRIHKDISIKLQKEKYDEIELVTTRMSGMFLLFPKSLWKDVGGFKEEGILDVDYDFSQKVQKVGKKIAVMKGVYVFHYYRMQEGVRDRTHLGGTKKGIITYYGSRIKQILKRYRFKTTRTSSSSSKS